MVTVKYSDLVEAFDFVNFSGPLEHRAYLSLDTGAIHWVSDDDAFEDDLPEDLGTSDRYLAIPDKNELDLGHRLVLAFVDEHEPDSSDQVVEFFRRRGAYGRFKEWLAARRLVDAWYAFEADATQRALSQWCSDNGLTAVDDGAA